MSETIQLGAFEVATNKYVLPYNAEKGKSYKCLDCNQTVIIRKGTIRKAHFAHFSPINKCTYYEHPNESQMHKDAKYKLAERLINEFPIKIYDKCPKCGIMPATFDTFDIEYNEGDKAVVEYRDPNNKWVADVAILTNGKLRYIFEIKHTHATVTNVRPEPWFEFTTEEVFLNEERINNKNHSEHTDLGDAYRLNCVRTSKNRYCNGCRIQTESWAENLPRLHKKYGQERGWKQDIPCIKCKGISYNPVFIKGFRQICKICIDSHEDNLKKEYAITECMFLDD